MLWRHLFLSDCRTVDTRGFWPHLASSLETNLKISSLRTVPLPDISQESLRLLRRLWATTLYLIGFIFAVHRFRLLELDHELVLRLFELEHEFVLFSIIVVFVIEKFFFGRLVDQERIQVLRLA